MANTKSSLDTMFKYNTADKVNELVPNFSIIQKMLGNIKPAQKNGRKYLAPVCLTGEGGVTYGDGSVFSYNADIAAVYDEAELNATPIVVKSRISLSAANAMLDDKLTFITKSSLQAGVMKESLMKRLEVECLWGKSNVGIGIIESQTGSGTTRALVLTAATFSPAIFGGTEAHLFECRNSSGTIQNADDDITLVSFDIATRTLNVSGDESDLDACGAGDVIYFKGAYSNGFEGVYKQLTNTGSLFGLDAAVYNLLQGTSYSVSGQLTMAKVLKGLGKAVSRGLASDVTLFVSPETFEVLNSDLSALRVFDSSFGKSGTSGFQQIKYGYQAGSVTVQAHPYVHPGYAFGMAKDSMQKIGRCDVTFDFAGNGEYYEALEGSAGFQILCGAEWCLYIGKPAHNVVFTGITN